MATWDETFEQFTHITDKLGKPIDAGIFETVVALNMLGIHTTQSCEGHLEWGLPYPWFDIQPEREQKFLLHKYLSQFYQNRPVNFENILVFHGYRVRSYSADFSTFYAKEEQQQKLNAYQAEMRALLQYPPTDRPLCNSPLVAYDGRI